MFTALDSAVAKSYSGFAVVGHDMGAYNALSTHIMVFPLEGWGWWIQSGYVFSALWGPNNAYYLMLVPIAVYLLSWSRSWRTDLLGMWLISRNTTKNGL